MYRPRWVMSTAERAGLDARNANLPAVHQQLGQMSIDQVRTWHADLEGSLAPLQRGARLDFISLGMAAVALCVCALHGFLARAPVSLFVACLLPICVQRLAAGYQLSRDTFFGTTRQIAELRAHLGSVTTRQ